MVGRGRYPYMFLLLLTPLFVRAATISAAVPPTPGAASDATAIERHTMPATKADRDQTPLPPDPNRVVTFVRSQETDPAIDQFLQDHYVIVNTAVPQNGKLFVFLPGTYGRPLGYQWILDTAARTGYRAIGLEYPDATDDPALSTVGAICATDPDPRCLENVRQERLTGEDTTDKIDVSPANSIENRLLKLLLFLQGQQPDGGWDAFVQDGQINWPLIAVGGHSQGAGMAAFIGKQHSVARVALWSGPSDYAPAERAEPGGESAGGTTPADEYYGLVHADESGKRGILGGYALLGLDRFGASVTVADSAPPYGNTHLLIVSLPPRPGAGPDNASHGSVAVDARTPLNSDGTPAYRDAWMYLLGP